MLLITSHFILWLLQTSCSIFIDVAWCYNHSHVFDTCCTIFIYMTIILAVLLKSEIFKLKNLMCPLLLLNKNYLRNYLELKNHLEVPEWHDDSWRGNCYNYWCHMMMCVSDLLKVLEIFTWDIRQKQTRTNVQTSTLVSKIWQFALHHIEVLWLWWLKD